MLITVTNIELYNYGEHARIHAHVLCDQRARDAEVVLFGDVIVPIEDFVLRGTNVEFVVAGDHVVHVRGRSAFGTTLDATAARRLRDFICSEVLAAE
jgi:hypothetical protein